MRPPRSRAAGAALLMAIVLLAVILIAAAALRASGDSLERDRARLTEGALAQAREALIAYAAGHPVNASVGPGYLPCPDLDNDGWAEPTCGSLSGDTGQEQRLGRFPWKTLGLPDLRDGHGERLWYAVSTKYKGLLNCGASRSCVDMTPPAALGTITVRDASGMVLHDGTVGDAARGEAGGAAAVVIAPGPAIERAGAMQRRAGGNEPCVATPPQREAACDPANYLDLAAGLAGGGEDNAAFVDRSDAAGRARNRDGFVNGPVTIAGRVAVNDRIAVVTYGDLTPRIMRRVALEVAACLRFYASRRENASRMPWMAAACADPSLRMQDAAGNREGRLPDTPFAASAAYGLLDRWWRASPRVPEALGELPTRDDSCRIAIPPDDAGPVRSALPPSPSDEGSTAGAIAPSWWNAWKPYVTVAIAPAFAPDASGTAGCTASRCIAVADADGRTVAAAASAVIAVHRAAGACAMPLTRCDASGCTARAGAGDALAWLP